MKVNFAEIISNPGIKKGIGIASTVVTVIVAVAGALADQKKAREFEELKETVAALQQNSQN